MPYSDKSRYYDIPGQHHKRAGLDRSAWNRFVQKLTGSTGRASEAQAKRQLDPVFHAVAEGGLNTIKDDTPVDTGLLRDSWEHTKNGDADHSIINELYYAPIVESREPGGPAKYKGAMMNQNRAKIEADLQQSVERFVEGTAR